MKLVAIDIGTTRIKCGRFDNDTLKESWYYPTKDSASIGGDLLARVGQDDIALSSVAPKATIDIEKALGRKIFKVTPAGQNFIKDFHPEYGSDRVADTVAARMLYAPNKNLAVIAMGTCTVLTTALANGIVDGGFITLGYHRMVSELQVASPLVEAVRGVDYRKYALDFGFTTNDQIINGAALGQIGIVERWLKLTREKLGEPLVTVATGGNAVLLTNIKNEQEKIVDYIDAELTIKGIQLIYNAQR